MKRPILSRLLIAAGLCLAGAATGCGPSDPARAPASSGLTDPLPGPNIALFIIDTLRADALGCYGADLPDTSPELDALAARGVRFEHVYAQCSWTRPSVGSMLTGLYPRRIGIYHEVEGILGDSFATLAEILREHGYATFGITANPHMNASYNFHQGFDTYVDSDAVYKFMEMDSTQTQYKKSSLAPATEMFKQVLEFDRRRRAVPKYVQMNLMEVHEWYRGLEALTRPEYSHQYLGLGLARYYRPVRQTSADLSAFVETLRKRPGWDDALFVFVSDHGEGLDSHPNIPKSTHHGRLLYESQLRVPLVLYREGWELAGRVVERPVRLMDLMPTVLDAVGLPVPPDLDGVSLMPAVREAGAPLPLPEYFVAETWMRGHDKAAVYGEGWRYYCNPDGQRGTALHELQIAGRPERGEATSVLDENRAKADEMDAYLKAWRKRYPPAPTIPRQQAVSQQELEQLRALGYVD
jgi:arylsulfatase A-like enzyme